MKIFQRNLNCCGEPLFLEELKTPMIVAKENTIRPGTKIILAYLGIDSIKNSHQYLIWLDSEGGMVVEINHPPQPDMHIVLSEKGLIGYGEKDLVPIKMEVTWENKRPQAKRTDTGEIIEFYKLPAVEPLRETFKVIPINSFFINKLLFGNPNIINVNNELIFMSPEGDKLTCLHDSLCINMGKDGPRLRKLIGNANFNPGELKKIIHDFQDEINRL
ncbi:MAG: hypothetical protein WC564_01475 [Patescibacteria group bacterium]